MKDLQQRARKEECSDACRAEGNPASVTIRGIDIGGGMPLICVPITAGDSEALIREAELAAASPADIIEWRLDCFEQFWIKRTGCGNDECNDPSIPGQESVGNKNIRNGNIRNDNNRNENAETENIVKDSIREKSIGEIIELLRERLGGKLLLVTLRSKGEGGCADPDPEGYYSIISEVIRTGLPDLIDVELSVGDETVRRLIEEAHDAGIAVILSSHDFEGTPERDEIISRLCRMQDLGADITKIAVMPRSSQDVVTLLSAALEMKENLADRPMIAISMGKQGVISRIAAEYFGSAITFASVTGASAPGQTDAAELKAILSMIHNSEAII